MTIPNRNLLQAIEKEDAHEVQSCLAAGADVNERDLRPLIGGGNTPLLTAACLGNSTIAQLLIEAGADVNAQCDLGWSPLMRACNGGYLTIAALLLTAGADPNIRNNEGYSVLGRVPGHMPELIRLLENWGGEI